jgi:hypothetical protein
MDALWLICYWDRNKQQYRYNTCRNKIYYLTIKYLENELLQLTLKIEGKNGGGIKGGSRWNWFEVLFTSCILYLLCGFINQLKVYKFKKCCGKTNKTSILGGSLNMSLLIQIFLHTMKKMSPNSFCLLIIMIMYIKEGMRIGRICLW